MSNPKQNLKEMAENIREDTGIPEKDPHIQHLLALDKYTEIIDAVCKQLGVPKKSLLNGRDNG